MSLVVLLASALLVQVPADGPMELRLVAAGTGEHVVDWYVDQTWVANTSDGEAVHVQAQCPCDVWVTTAHEGEWRALVRPAMGPGPGQVAYVDGWSVQHVPAPRQGPAMTPFLLLATGAAVVIGHRFRPKRP